MAIPPNPLLRVATSGAEAKCKNYSQSAATAGHVLTATGEETVPVWAALPAPAPGVRPVAQTLFVDAVNFAPVPTGTLAAPFQTVQQAIDQAVLNAWTQVQIIVAPATYADPINIPLALEMVIIEGWGPTTFLLGTILGGNITYASQAGGWANLILRDVTVTAASITTLNAANEDLTLALQDVICGAVVTAANIQLELFTSVQSADVTAAGGLNVNFDGFSWQRHLLMAPTFSAVGIYTRGFNDAGHDIYQRNLTVAAVAIGTTAFQAMAVPAYTRAGDAVSIQVIDPSIRDFICGVHGVDAGSVVVWLTNLSRVSTDFDEPIQLLFHHNQMIIQP